MVIKIKNMKNFFKKILFVSLVLILFYLLFLLLGFLFEQIYINKDSAYIENGLGAFFGAFFAFIFLILGNLFSKIYNRNKKHSDALVKLEYLLNEYSSINSDNIFLIRGFIELLEKGDFYVCIFKKLEIDRSILLDLYNIDFINDIFSLNIEIYKDNESLNTITKLYTELKSAYLEGKINKETYDNHIKTLVIPSLKYLKECLVALDLTIKDTIVKTRILLEPKSIIGWFTKIILRKSYYPKKFEILYKKELEKVEKEYEEVKKKSEEKIEKIKKMIK